MDINKLARAYQAVQPSEMLQMFNAAIRYPEAINLGIGEPDFDTDASIIEAAAVAGRQGFTHYPPVPGFPDLRQGIADYWKERHGLDASAAEVIVTAGGVNALYLALQVLLDPGDEVLVPTPCFTAYLQQISYLQGQLVEVPVREADGFRLTAADLERHITPRSKVLILNSPNNPTGAVIDRAELEKIAAIVAKHDLMVIADEIYEAFLFEGQHVAFATLPGMKERTFTVAGFSKTYAMTGWRIGYVIAPAEAVNRMTIIGAAMTTGVNSLAQKGALYALRHRNDATREMVEIYRQRAEHVVRRVNQIKNLSCIEPKGAFYVFVNIQKTGLTALAFCLKCLEQAQVVMIPGTAFGAAGEGFVRIACTVPIDKLDVAFDRLAGVLDGGQ